MIKQKSLIGTEIDHGSYTIEAGQFARLNQAFLPADIAQSIKEQEAGKNDWLSQMPPFLVGNLINLPTIYRTLGLNINHLLLSRESIICHQGFKAGDTIAIRTFLKDAYEQQASSNPIGFVVLESVGTLKEDIAFYVERVIAVRGGFQRGRAQ